VKNFKTGEMNRENYQERMEDTMDKVEDALRLEDQSEDGDV